MELYDAPPGYSDPDVPEGYSDPSKQKSGLAKLWERAKSGGSEWLKKKIAEEEAKQKMPFGKRLVNELGNTAMPAGDFGLLSAVNKVVGDGSPTKAPLGMFSPNAPTPARMVKGGVLDPLGAVAGVATRATGYGVEPVQSAIDTVKNYYDKNFDESPLGEAAGGFITTGGLASRAGTASQVALTAKERGKQLLMAAGKGAVATPMLTAEANVKDDNDFWSRKWHELWLGGLIGAGSNVAGQVAGKVTPALKTVANAETPEEIVASMRTNYQGSPAQALPDATRSNFGKDIQAAKQVYAPGDAAGKSVDVDLSGVILSAENTLANAKKSGRVLHPESKDLINSYLNQWKEVGKTTWEDAVGLLSDLKTSLFEMDGKKNIDKKPFEDAITALENTLKSASPTAFAGQQAGDKAWSEGVSKHFTKTAGNMRKARGEADALDILTSLRPGPTKRMDVSAVSDLADAGGIQPIVDDWVASALERSGGNPRVFRTHLESGMQALRLKDPALADRVQAALDVARFSAPMGMLANIGASKIPGGGTAATMGASMAPAYAGPGLSWKAMQSGPVRSVAGAASGIPNSTEGSPFEAIVARYLLGDRQ